MSNRSILFFDIDGTLIADDPSRYLPDSAKEAIRLARQAGHLTFINTGRVMVNVDAFIRELDFDGYVCGCGTYIRYQDQVLLHHKLEQSLCKDIAQLAYECGFFSLFEAHDLNSYDVRVPQPDETRELLTYFKKMGKEMLTDVESDAFHFDKFSAWFDDTSNMERFRQGIAGAFEYIDRGPTFCEIVPKGFSKATGIAFLLDYFGIPWENSYAFGDSNNDLPMLEYVNHSIVMGESNEQLKSLASFVTKGVREDGLYYAMEQHGLLG